MNRLLRVLIVEDSEDDTLLVVREFKQAGYDVSFERVQTEAAMEAALSKEKWDVIISDYVMPDFSGLKALRLLQRKGIDLPFIIVSGKIGEDVAVEVIKAGAHDYLMKNNLKRLVVAVEHEIREAENRRELKKTEEALQAERQRFSGVLEVLPVMICLLTPDYHVPFTNKRFRENFGESQGQRCFEYIFHRTEPCPECQTFKPLETHAPHHWEWAVPDGRYYDIYDFPFTDPNGLTMILEMVMDITERKRAEEALKKSEQCLRDAGEMAKVGGWELDLATKEVLLSEEVCRIHGVEPGYKPTLEEALNFYASESRPDVEAVVKKAAETGEPYDLESLFIPSGSKDKIWVRSLGGAVYSGGKIVKLAGTFQNIDKYKRAQEALRKNEERYRLLAENVTDVIWTADMNLRFTYFSPSSQRQRGYTAEEAVNQSLEEILTPQSFQVAMEVFAEELKKEEEGADPLRSRTLELEQKCKDGSTIWTEVTTSSLRDKSGRPIGILGITRNITERKQAEEDLKKKILELEDFHKLTIDRELKMLELKKEIDELKARLKEK